MKNSLYTYQADLASQVLDEFKRGRSNVVLAAACGAGKTITSIAICERLLKDDPTLRILVLTHGQVILRTQFVDDIKEQEPEFTYAVVKSCKDLEVKAQVYIGLPHTIHRCKTAKFDIIIIDEAHHFYFSPNGMVQGIIRNSKPRSILFLTGSPSKFIKQKYTLHSISLLELLELGRICSPVIELAKTTYDYTFKDYNPQDELKSTVELSSKQTKETLDSLITQIQRMLKSDTRAVPEARTLETPMSWGKALCLLEKTMFVCRSQKQAWQITTYFKNAGVNVALSTSRFDVDSLELARFKSDETCVVLVVVNRGILGFNMPELVNVVDMSGSLNVDVLFQMFARLVRKHPNGKRKLFLKVVPEVMSEYVYALMSFVIALSHKRIYDTYSGDSKKTKIPVPRAYLDRVHDGVTRHGAAHPRSLKFNELPPLPCIEVMKSLMHESGELLSSYAYTTLEEVRNRFNISFRPFNEAREYARSLGLKSSVDWHGLGARRPADVPSNPNLAYKDQWNGYADWLGTGNKHKGDFLSFEEARAHVQTLGFTNTKEWRLWAKIGRPETIPSSPPEVYRDHWVSWGDWFGTGTISKSNRTYVSFEEARAYVRSMGLKTSKDWKKWCKSKRPDNIPSSPTRVYKDDWVSWSDWMGIAPRIEVDPFNQARAYVRSLGLKSQKEWVEWTKAARPKSIPSRPARVYKHQWVGWGDWLGTGTACTNMRQFLSFDDARAFVRSMGLKKQSEWGEWSKSRRPDNIPSNPQKVYKGQWVGCGDWLGTA